jgi:hypothetical protein
MVLAQGRVTMLQRLLLQKDASEKPVIPFDLSLLKEVVQNADVEMFHKVSRLAEEQGSNLNPDDDIFFCSMRNHYVELFHELSLSKNELGESSFELDDVYLGYYQMGYARDRFAFRLASSHMAMRDAIRTIVEGKSFDAAIDPLNRAYNFSPIHFFREMDDILTPPGRPYKPAMLAELRHFVENLIQTELQNPALPLCEIEFLQKQKEKFFPTASPRVEM